MGGVGGGRKPAHPDSSGAGQKAPAGEFKQSDEQIELLSDISLGFSSDLARDFVLEQYKGTESKNEDVDRSAQNESCASSSHSSTNDGFQDEVRDGGAGSPVYSNSLNIFTARTQSSTSETTSNLDQDTIVNNHDNSPDSNGPELPGDDPGNRNNKPSNNEPEKPKSDRPFPYHFILDRNGLGFDIDVKTSTRFRDEIHKRYDLLSIDIKHALARPPDSFKSLVVELGYPQFAEDAEVDALTPFMSFQCGNREVIVPRYSRPNALIRLKASVDSSVSRAIWNIDHFARKYRADYANHIVFPIPMHATDALIKSRHERIENIKKYVSNSLKRLERDLKKRINELGLEINNIDFEKFRSAVFRVLDSLPEQFEIESKGYNLHFENHEHALAVCIELEHIFEHKLIAQITGACEKMVEEELSILESPFVSQEEKNKVKPKVDDVFDKREELITWLRKRFGHVRKNEDENRKVKYEYLPTRFLYRLYLELRKINTVVYELEVIGRNVVHSFVKHLSKLYYNGAQLFVEYNIHPWSSSTLEPYLHAHLLMLNVIKTEDGRYIRVRPFFGANLEKTKEPYKKVMHCLSRVIKLVDKLPGSFELLAKLKEHKALIYRANRNRTTTREFNVILDEIDRSETAVRRTIDAYIASLSSEEKIRFANEIALLKDFWSDVIAEWAEYIRVRAKAIREGLNVLQEAYKRALEENGIPIADVPKFEFKATEELDEETNPNADSPKKPYVWVSYFKLDRRATLRHVLKYMSRRPVQDIALYCYKHGDAPKLPYDWLDQLISYRNQRSALGLARENYALLHTIEGVKKFSEQFNKLEEKINQITAQHPEFAERLAQIVEPLADAKKCVEELGKMLEKGKPLAQETFLTYIETVKFALEKIQQTNVFDAEELKEKQSRFAELNKQKAEIEAVRFECAQAKQEIAKIEDWINAGVAREEDKTQLEELKKKVSELEQKLTELAPTEQKISEEMRGILKTLDVAKQTVEFQEDVHEARTAIEQIENELKEDKHYCPLCGRVTAKPTYLTTDMLAGKVEKGLVLYYIDPETRRARLCVSSKAPNAREVVSFFAVKSYTARAMLELEKTRYVDKVVSEWFVSEFSRSKGDKHAGS
jgi:hypothetical protein